MFKFIKKAIAMCLIGIGLGMLLVLLLPMAGWLFSIGVIIIAVGLLWLFC